MIGDGLNDLGERCGRWRPAVGLEFGADLETIGMRCCEASLFDAFDRDLE